MCWESLWIWASLYGGLFSVEGNPVCEGAHTPGTLLDGWRRALVVGHLPVRDSMKGTLGGRFPYQGTQKMGFLRDLQDSLYTGLSLHGGLVGGPGGGSSAGTFGRLEKYIWGPFFGPRFIKIRALGVGYLSARDSIKGTVREGSFTGEPERWSF
jgi:hypothetical protein